MNVERFSLTGAAPNLGGPAARLVRRAAKRDAATPRVRRLPLAIRCLCRGAKCFGAIRGLFGGAASRVAVPAARVIPIDETTGEQGVLLALAATAYHAAPTVWEINPRRCGGAEGYQVVHPDADTKRGYRCICDVSGDGLLIDQLVSLDGLITHRENPHDATAAYRTAFTDPDCLRMVFNWSNAAYPSAG